MNAGLAFGKVVTLGVWVWALAGTFGAPVPGAESAMTVAIALAVAHIVEIVVFLPKLKDVEGSTASHAVNLFIFGMFHYRSVKPVDKPA